MKQSALPSLVLGDIFVILLLTIIGFATHQETGLEFLPRLFVNFLPLSLAWCLIAWALRLFETDIASNLTQLWRPLLGALFAGPMAAILRGIFLNSNVPPIFALVLSATTALGILLWRFTWIQLDKRNP